MIARLLFALAARLGAALEVHEPPDEVTPEQLEQARRDMRQAAITDGISWKVDHLPAAQILDDLAEWNAEFPALDTG